MFPGLRAQEPTVVYPGLRVQQGYIKRIKGHPNVFPGLRAQQGYMKGT